MQIPFRLLPEVKISTRLSRAEDGRFKLQDRFGFSIHKNLTAAICWLVCKQLEEDSMSQQEAVDIAKLITGATHEDFMDEVPGKTP